MKKRKLTVNQLRDKTTDLQKVLLQKSWDHFRSTRQWPTIRSLCSTHGTSEVKNALSGLGGSIGFEQSGGQRWGTYQLTLLGALPTQDGSHLQDLVKTLFEFQRYLFLKEPDSEATDSTAIKSHLNLIDQDCLLFGELVRLMRLGGARTE